MKKKILSILIASMCIISLVACSNKEAKTNEIEDDGTNVITADELLSVYDFDVADYVELCDYNNIKVEPSRDYSVTEEQIISYIESMLSYNGSYEAIDKQNVEDGDIVNIDYTGYRDGVPLDGATESGAHLKIGSNSMIEGFETGLVGHQVGETVELNLTFPDDYWNEEQQGKEISFQVKINSIEKSTTPSYEELTDEYVKENYDYESVKEWYNAVKASLESSAEQQKYSDLQSSFISEIIKHSKVTLPDKLLEDELEETIRQVEVYARDSLDNMSLEDYLLQYEECNSIEEYKKKITDEVTEDLKAQLIVDAIIKDTNQSITEGGYTNFLTYYLDSYGMEEDAFYERYGSKESIRLIYAENLVISNFVDKLVGSDESVKNEEGKEEENPTSDETSKSSKKKVTTE